MRRSLLKPTLLARTACAALALAALAASVRADEPSITAVLTSSETTVGQAVQLQIQVKSLQFDTLMPVSRGKVLRCGAVCGLHEVFYTHIVARMLKMGR